MNNRLKLFFFYFLEWKVEGHSKAATSSTLCLKFKLQSLTITKTRDIGCALSVLELTEYSTPTSRFRLLNAYLRYFQKSLLGVRVS